MLQNGSSWEHMYFYQNANYIVPSVLSRQDANYICPHFVSALCMELVIYTDQTLAQPRALACEVSPVTETKANLPLNLSMYFPLWMGYIYYTLNL